MSKDNPETPPSIQMTPVQFSPTVSNDAIGSVNSRLPLNEMQFPILIPMSIILATLIFSTVRDIAGFNRRLADIDRVDAPSIEKLKQVPKQTEFIESLRVSLAKIAPTDPNAAAIMEQYFPAPKTDNQAGASAGTGSAPAK